MKLYTIKLPDGNIAMSGPYVLATENEAQADRMAHARDGDVMIFATYAPSVPDAVAVLANLRIQFEHLPIRREPISGQTFSYVERDNVMALIEQASENFSKPWPGIRDLCASAAQPSAKDGVRGGLTPEQEYAVAMASREQLLAEREEALKDYVSDYEMIGEDEAGRDCCYQPTEHERFLIEDAIRGWDALELPEIATTASGLVDGDVVSAMEVAGLAYRSEGKVFVGQRGDTEIDNAQIALIRNNLEAAIGREVSSG